MKRILVSVVAIALAIGILGAGAMAYFYDTETSSGNSFTAGTFDLQLQDGNESWGDGVTATWTSPNWAPGDPEVAAWLEMKDIGSIGADLVLVRGGNLSESDNGYNEPEGPTSQNNIADHIYITSIHYTENGVDLYGNIVGYYQGVFGDKAAPLTLKEFATSPYGMVFWIGGWPPTSDYLPPSGARVEKVKLGFTFEPNAGNDYQSDPASFDLTVAAVQHYSQVTLLGKGPGVPGCYGYSE